MKKLKKGEYIALGIAIPLIVFFFFMARSGQNSALLSGAEEINLFDIENSVEGFSVEDVVIGTGEEAVVGTRVSVHYVGVLEDGTEFDSSRTRGVPFEFILGSGYVIPGWDIGLQGMKPGGQRRLTIPPELGYGSQAIGPIPANATLVFEVELLSVSQQGE